MTTVQSVESEVPSWLEVPPETVVLPPSNTSIQCLPLSELGWEDFERLCLRLVRLEADVERCRIYGVKGQAQAGIDLYAKRKAASAKYTVYQCKKVERLSVAQIRAAVKLFVEGTWTNRSDRFVLCTSHSLAPARQAEELERQSSRLAERGIVFEWWDADELSIRLKTIPELVHDFFGSAWVSLFCPAESVRKLSRRLDANQRCGV
jgi:hypothetical protein